MLDWGLHSGVNRDLSCVMLRCDGGESSLRYFDDIMILLKIGDY